MQILFLNKSGEKLKYVKMEGFYVKRCKLWATSIKVGPVVFVDIGLQWFYLGLVWECRGKKENKRDKREKKVR